MFPFMSFSAKNKNKIKKIPSPMTFCFLENKDKPHYLEIQGLR